MPTELTPEQEAQLTEYCQKWEETGLSTGPTDYAAARSLLAAAYQAVNLPPPAMWIECASMRAGALAVRVLWGDQKAREELEKMGQTQVLAQVDAVQQAFREFEPPTPLPLDHGLGLHDAPWLAFADFCLQVLGQQELNALTPLMAYAEVAGCWWPFAGFCIISGKPTSTQFDDLGRLHCANGPAVTYADGWGLYFLGGIEVPARIVEHPEQITAQEVLEEPNVEMRSRLLTQMGIGRLVAEQEASVIHQDTDGLGRPRRLLEFPSAAGRHRIVLLDGRDRATGEPFLLRVPFDMKTCAQAVAWSYRITSPDLVAEWET